MEQVVFAYSDISHEELMHRASLVLAAGSDFVLIAPNRVQLKSKKPIVSICAVRTGVGKSSVARACYRYFISRGVRVVAVREPMPYGDLQKQACMRFATYKDLADHNCTVEEREEYELYVANGMVIYSGVDYAQILSEAEKEADVIIFDGGNNEISFFASDLLFVLADPLRPGHETRYHPGEANCRMADAFIVAKCHEASVLDIHNVETTLKAISKLENPPIVRLKSTIRFEHPEDDLAMVKNAPFVLVVDDGPTLTHGNMQFGAGFVMAANLHLNVLDPRPLAIGACAETFREFPHLTKAIPAMGYTAKQLEDLALTLNAGGPEVVVINGSPSDLATLLGDKLKVRMVRVLYDVDNMDGTKYTLENLLLKFAETHNL